MMTLASGNLRWLKDYADSISNRLNLDNFINFKWLDKYFKVYFVYT